MAPEEFALLLEGMREVSRRGIGADRHYGVFSGDPQRPLNALITLLYDRATGAMVAFNALSYMSLSLRGQDIQAVHLGLVMVDPGYRAKGLSWVLYGLTSMLIFVRRG